jgi:hypothetical protein
MGVAEAEVVHGSYLAHFYARVVTKVTNAASSLELFTAF